MIYYAPTTLKEFNKYCQAHDNISILAGGTDILPRWQSDSSIKPKVLVDIKKMNELNSIQYSDKEIIIGALTTIQELKIDPIIQQEFSALSQSAREFAGVQIRHRATIGGNICNASPAGDLIPSLYVYNAVIEIAGSKGKKRISIQKFITGVGQTALKKDEIVINIILPKSNEKSIFYKLGLRQSMAISVINFAIAYELDGNGRWKSLKIAAGSVAPTVASLTTFANALCDGNNVDESIQLVDNDISPIDDIRASSNYRRSVLKNVLKFTIKEIYVG
mgnify:CR=1 FL=1